MNSTFVTLFRIIFYQRHQVYNNYNNQFMNKLLNHFRKI